MFFFFFWSHNITQWEGYCFAIVFLQHFENIALSFAQICNGNEKDVQTEIPLA